MLKNCVYILFGIFHAKQNGKSNRNKQIEMENLANTKQTLPLLAQDASGVEAVFLELEGVKKVISGYEGGQVLNPTYKQVCSGQTGHAEVIQVIYDPANLLLKIYWPHLASARPNHAQPTRQ